MNAAKRIWLVENDDELREMLALVLRKMGLDVLELSSGRQILDAWAVHPRPDMLVTDHHMPEMNGLDAVETLRDQGANLPIVLVTAFAEPSVRARADRLEVLLVEKPCDLSDLRTAILAHLDP